MENKIIVCNIINYMTDIKTDIRINHYLAIFKNEIESISDFDENRYNMFANLSKLQDQSLL